MADRTLDVRAKFAERAVVFDHFEERVVAESVARRPA